MRRSIPFVFQIYLFKDLKKGEIQKMIDNNNANIVIEKKITAYIVYAPK